jgi:hypothetical protein
LEEHLDTFSATAEHLSRRLALSRVFVSLTTTWHYRPYQAISPTRPEVSAAERHRVIAGGGTSIGKAAAIAFAQAGAKSVSIIRRRIDRLETAGAAILETN